MTGRAMLATAAAVCVAAALSGCGSKSFDKKTLNFTEKDTNNFGFADNPPATKQGNQGPENLSPGDALSFSSDVLKGGKPVGQLDATCIDTRPGAFDKASVTCHGTFTLPEGQLFVAVGGPKAFGSSDTKGAVVGGTGSYAGATGTFSSVGDSNSKDTFKLFIPK
jgi:hypothetical protein